MRKFIGSFQITTSARTVVVRGNRGSGKALIIAPEFLQKRTYGYSAVPPGYPPPPPPPGTPAPQSQYYYGGGNAYPQPMAPPPSYYPVPMPPFQSDLGTSERPIVVVSAPQKASWQGTLWLFLLIGIGISLFISIVEDVTGMASSRSTPGSRGPGFMFNNSDVTPVPLDDLTVTFESIRGCDEAKKELEDIVEFLKDPEKFHAMGGYLPKGALLVGPPGCGKTLLAKAIAKDAGVTFFYATGSEFDELYVGVGARRVRELFSAAKLHAPALIFIDEIDALGGKRSKSDHSYSRMTLNQLLAEMDGFNSNKDSVFVLAATNTPDSLDKALTRPGRLDTTIAIDPPDMKGRAEVLQLYLDKIKKDNTVSAMEIARGTTGFTGAELSNLVNIAAIRAAVLNKSRVTKDEIEYAKDRVMMGTESKKVIPEEERRVTAFHEGGHALSAILLKDQGAEPVHKATIVPRGSGIMGLVQQQPDKDRYSQSKRQCLARLKVCVAGRVGEELLLGSDDVTTGASSDFQQATNMARNMVRRFGFSDEVGFVDYGDSSDWTYISDETKKKMEDEVNKLVANAYKDTKAMLIEHRKELEIIADSLLKYETLSGEDLNKILKGEPIPPRPTRIVPTSTSSPNNSVSSASNNGKSTVPIS